MPWMDVVVIHENGDTVDNVINTDTIVRFGQRAEGGTFIRFVDGSTVQVADPMDEILNTVLQADARKKE